MFSRSKAWGKDLGIILAGVLTCCVCTGIGETEEWTQKVLVGNICAISARNPSFEGHCIKITGYLKRVQEGLVIYLDEASYMYDLKEQAVFIPMQELIKPLNPQYPSVGTWEQFRDGDFIGCYGAIATQDSTIYAAEVEQARLDIPPLQLDPNWELNIYYPKEKDALKNTPEEAIEVSLYRLLADTERYAGYYVKTRGWYQAIMYCDLGTSRQERAPVIELNKSGAAEAWEETFEHYLGVHSFSHVEVTGKISHYGVDDNYIFSIEPVANFQTVYWDEEQYREFTKSKVYEGMKNEP